MPYCQRDIVKVKRPLPGGQEETHPFLIISNKRSNSHERRERSYVGVMLTDSLYKDKFSFPVTKDMVDGSVNDGCQVRPHIIAFFNESDISRDSTKYLGNMKKPYFIAVLNFIKDNIISPD
jgi:hypothetical protein